MQCAYRSSYRTGSDITQNRSVARINRRLNEMRKVDASATRESAVRSLQDMDPEEQSKYDSYDTIVPDTVTGIDVPDEPPPFQTKQKYGSNSWSASDGHWPVAKSVIESCAGGSSGFASVGNKLRWKSRSRIVSQSDSKLIPPDRNFHCRQACIERHPGLCFSNDSAIYKDAIALAVNIERFCNQSIRAHYLLFTAGEDVCDVSDVSIYCDAIPVYFAEQRERRSFAPQRVVFVHCEYQRHSEVDEVVWYHIGLQEEETGGSFRFASVWTIAKQVLAWKTEAFVRVGSCRWLQSPIRDNITDAKRLVSWPAACTKIWPGVYKAPKKTHDPVLEGLIERKPVSQRRRTGKIKFAVGLPGGVDVLQQNVDETEDSEEDVGVDVIDEADIAKYSDKGSKRGGDYLQLPVPGGILHWSPKLKQLNCHCGQADHKKGNVKCKMDRQLVLASGRARPIGLMMAWLAIQTKEKADHADEKKRLASAACFHERQAGRKVFEDLAKEKSDAGELAREILKEEMTDFVDNPEPLVAR